MLEPFLAAHAQLSDAYRAGLRRSWRRFERCGGPTAEGWRAFLGSLGSLPSSSARQHRDYVAKILRWAFARGLLESEIYRQRLVTALPTLEKLRPGQRRALFASFDHDRPQGLRDAALFWLVAETDLGLTGALDLKLGQHELLTLSVATRHLLQRYLWESRPSLERGPCDALFLHRGRPMGRAMAYQRLQNAAHRAGIIGVVSPLALRSPFSFNPKSP